MKKNKKYRLKKPITELVDDTLSMIAGDSKDHVNANVKSAKTMDARVQATTQPFSWNRRLGSGSEFYPDSYFSVSEGKDKLKENNNSIKRVQDELSKKYIFNNNFGINGIGIEKDEKGEFIRIMFEREPDIKIPDNYKGFRIKTEYVGKIKPLDLSEQNALNMIEDILSKRSDLRDIDIPSSIPEFNELQQQYPIISKQVTILIDKIKDKEQELNEYGATILSSIMDSFNIDKIPYKVKKILINKLKGVKINNNL